jgi:hypothetical protein
MNGAVAPKATPHLIVTGTSREERTYAMRNYGNRGVLGVSTPYLIPHCQKVGFFERPEPALKAVRDGA